RGEKPLLRRSSCCRPSGLAIEKFSNRFGDFLMMCLQREVAGVVEMDLSARVIAFERFRARRQEKGIVLAPHCQHGWAFASEVLLEPGIKRDIAGIIQKQVQLD